MKDLRIEETAVKPKPQQQVPDDPAILGVRINISIRLPPSKAESCQRTSPPTMRGLTFYIINLSGSSFVQFRRKLIFMLIL